MSNATPTKKKDIHAAITELVIELMGEGIVQALAVRLKMSRNRLVRYIKSYNAQMKGEEYSPMCWDLDTLVIIAQEMKIRVSEVIRAAEDVQAGLPPWFHHRISADSEPNSQDRLVNISLEAVGCNTGESDPLGVKGQRKSRYRQDNKIPKEVFFDFWKSLKAFWGRDEIKEFTELYCKKKISDAFVYREFKKVVDLSLKERKQEDDGTSILSITEKLLQLEKQNIALQDEILKALNTEHHLIAETLTKDAFDSQADTKEEI